MFGENTLDKVFHLYCVMCNIYSTVLILLAETIRAESKYTKT